MPNGDSPRNFVPCQAANNFHHLNNDGESLPFFPFSQIPSFGAKTGLNLRTIKIFLISMRNGDDTHKVQTEATRSTFHQNAGRNTRSHID